ncbi:DPP IV N-terminal domain-containing protein [Novosphingobium flavum]|uniref:S9 family peptidase n=1 Tax=Novosphingobium aerophilum TaxID=2839843 RepID=UPI00163A63AD|nr:S9 family peptidase [Novosphingobium aerophilum]MBC2662596.1 DPP IV N-terminal domain-containing protein [Novosphingobium aerophilum]
MPILRPALLACCALLLPVPPAFAGAPVVTAPEGQQAGTLTLERVYASPGLNGPSPRGVKLSPDGRWLTVLRNRPDDRERYDLWGFDRKSGQWTMLVDSRKLSSGRELSEAEKMQRERMRVGDLKGIISYDWNADGKSLLVPLDGDLLLVGLDGAARRLDGVSADARDAALSPKGGYVSFVAERRFWVGAVAGGKPVAISPDEASATVHWGEAEFVAQEEMARFKGAWWAPDDSRVALERFDEAKVGVVTRAAIGAAGTRTFEQRYPAAGTANAEVSLWVMKPDGTERVRVDLGSDPDIYLARVDWAPDGRTLYVQRQNRAQTRLDLLAVDPTTGAAQVLLSETARDKSWVNLSDAYRFLKDGSLIWWSERDGFGRLYHYPKGRFAAADARLLTPGPGVVTALVGVDQARHRLFYTSTGNDPLEQQVYALDWTRPGAPQRLTEPGWVNAASMDKAGQNLLVTRSAQAQPPQVYLIKADGSGERVWVEQNAVTGDHPYAPYLKAHRAPTFGTAKAADGTELHWRMITPVMEPGKRYPVFFSHYGGPHVQVVNRAWTGALAQAIVAKGYIYFEIDNRGSANRGVAFESPIWRAMGSVEVADQKAGLDYLKGLPFVDPTKVAIYGWSYGGYMTLKMLEADPGAYAAGIAGAPVTKWELYDTHYTERYMGDPREVPEAYARSGTIADAARISDPLLLIHGMADDNVVFDNSTAMIAKLQAEGVPFEMMLYPGYTHRVTGPKIGPHVWNTIFVFLERHGVTPPR